MLDRNLALEVVRVTEAAALAASALMGRGEKDEADQAAVTAMRAAFQSIAIRGRVVIGEGERDEAPMLYIGEEVGCGDESDPQVDIAVDPLEGTNLCAFGKPNALAVVALASNGNFLHAPDTYMEKIASGKLGQGVIDIKASPTDNLEALARAKNCSVNELTAVILERERHHDLIREVRSSGARIRLISDGDVSAAIATCMPQTGIDILFGTGGAPEGVLAAAALRCLDGEFQGIVRPRNTAEAERAEAMGVVLDRVYRLNDLASGEVMFAATGVTPGDLLGGVRYTTRGAQTSSMVMRSKSGTIRTIEADHSFILKPYLDHDRSGR